jgi:hypothetical protein
MKPTSSEPAVFRAAPSQYVLVAIVGTFFTGLGIFVGLNKGDWAIAAFGVAAAAVLLGLILYLRLEVRADGFTYRTLIINCDVAYSQVLRGHFVTEFHDGIETGARFALELHDGSMFRPRLRSFPIQATALLFDRLEQAGVPVRDPDSGSAKRLCDKITAARAK